MNPLVSSEKSKSAGRNPCE